MKKLTKSLMALDKSKQKTLSKFHSGKIDYYEARRILIAADVLTIRCLNMFDIGITKGV